MPQSPYAPIPDSLRAELARRLAAGEIDRNQAAGVIQRYQEQNPVAKDQQETSSALQQDTATQEEPEVPVSDAIENTEPGFFARIGEAFTGSERQTEATRNLPEIVDVPFASSPELAFNALTSFDTDEIKNVIKQEFGEDALRIDEKGNDIAFIGGQEYVINKPGFSKADVAAALGNAIAFAPAAKAAGFFKTLGSKLAAGAGASGLTQAGIEVAQSQTGGTFDLLEIALASGFGTLGELPAAIMSSRRLGPEAARLLPDVSLEKQELAKRVQSQIGVDLLPSQISGSKSDTLLEMTLANTPELANKFTDLYKKQNKQVAVAAGDFLNALGASDAAALAASNVRQEGARAIQSAREARRVKTQPLYQDIWQNTAQTQQNIDVQPVVDMLEAKRTELAGTKQIAQVNRLIADVKTLQNAAETGENAGSNALKLHRFKSEQGKALQNLKQKGEWTPGIDEAYKDAFEATRQLLIDNVDGYDNVNNLYRELSPAVDLLENNVIGRIANIDDGKLKQVANTIFDSNEFAADKSTFLTAKEVIKNANPEAWNALISQRIRSNILDVAEMADADNINVPNELYKKAFSGKEKAMISAALDGEMKKNYLALSEAMRIARARASGSQTASLQELNRRLEGKSGVGEFFSAAINNRASDLFQKAIGVGSNKKKNIRILSEVYLNPRWSSELESIRKLGMDTPKGGAAFAQLFRDVSLNSEQDEVVNSESEN